MTAAEGRIPTYLTSPLGYSQSPLLSTSSGTQVRAEPPLNGIREAGRGEAPYGSQEEESKT
ncbi:dynein heavy chain 6, axonemal-like [Platysternon megacephalum]|uniref:Dynein heavy chain 6, axonemal-like n=1 Tax=Platysternon megacephalum TaxID=55544 RepID=A0A4D9EWX6_9SAUR|nr:dynein heavy chain 6, axonemal-like [Platysternon megacephalum]